MVVSSGNNRNIRNIIGCLVDLDWKGFLTQLYAILDLDCLRLKNSLKNVLKIKS